MDLHGILEICILILISTYVIFTYFSKGKKMPWHWSLIVDSVPWVIANLHKFHDLSLDMMLRRNGTHFINGTWLGTTDYIWTVDPANVHYMTTSNFQNYPKGDQYRRILDIMGYALFNSDDEDWKQYRRLIHSPIKSRDYLNYSIKIAHTKLSTLLVPLLKHVSENKDRVLDMQDVFQRFSLDVVCIGLTGHDPKSLDGEFPKVPFLDALADFEGGIIYRTALPPVLWKLQLLMGVGPETRLDNARKIINRYISDIVSRKRHDVLARYGKSNNDDELNDDEEGADFLTLLMRDVITKDDVKKTHITNINDDKFFQDITLQQIIAGRDTTSSAMTWFIWLISTHPHVEQKIRNEINATIPGAKAHEWRVFDHRETNQLIYLHAALNESMRLYPPVPNQYKTPRQPDTLPTGHHVHPNMKILIPLYAMARMKSIWGNNCNDFEPERWITERGTIKHEPESKFFVFYAGPRSCMGKDAAMTQMKMVAATLIHNFKFELGSDQNVSHDVSMILHVKNGLNVKVHNRWASI